MKLRQKVFFAISSLVVLTSLTFFTISHGYLAGLFRQYATTTRQDYANFIATQLEGYYLINGDSWTGVDKYVVQVFGQGSADQIVSMVITDPNGQVILQETAQQQGGRSQHANPAHINNGGTVTVPLKVDGHPIGSLQVRDRGIAGLYSMEQTVLHSAMLATAWGTVVTAIVALAIAFWFARLVTRPLQGIVKGMRRIGSGDLNAKLSANTDDEFGEVAEAFNDMTDRLYRTEEARKRLVADVAHELRMPLTIMQGQLELIQQGVKTAEPETLLPIQDEVFRLTRLVQDLHQLSLAEVGKLPLNTQTVNLGFLMERIMENFEFEFSENGVALEFHESAEDLEVEIDRDRITQVIVNLLGNAIRYTPEGGEVHMSLEKVDGGAQVAITDSGAGIPEEHLPHIFDRFYRAESDRSRGSGGTGLGLAIAKEYVEAHRGRIYVESELGKGTTFKVWLPLSAPPGELPA